MPAFSPLSRALSHLPLRFGLLCGLAGVLAATSAEATIYTKADNTTTMTTNSSWVGGANHPLSSADTALFDGTMSAATAAAGVNIGALTAGIFSFANNLNGPVTFNLGSTNTFTLGGLSATSIIDMSAANQDVTINGATSFLRLGTLSGQQNFNVVSGRTLTINVANLSSHGNSDVLGLIGGGNIVINSNVLSTQAIGLNVNGANTTLSGNNTWAPNGSTAFMLTSGTLNFGSNNAVQTAVGNTKAFTIAGGTLTASGAARAVVTNGGFLLTGAATVAGSNALTFNSSFTNSGNQTLTVNNSALTTLSSNVYLSETTATARTLTVNGSGITQISGVIADANGAGLAGGLTYSGSGVLQVSNAGNSFRGNLTVSSGAVRLDNALAAQNATVSLSVANGLTFNTGVTSATIAALTGSNLALTNNDGTTGVNLSIGNNNTAWTYGGVLSGAGSLTKIGSATGVLSVGGQSYGGGTNVSGGTLQASVGGNTASNLFGAGTVALSVGGRVRFNSTAAVTFNSALDVGTGGGTLSFRANSTFSPTAITGTGTLTVDLDNNVTLTPSTLAGFGGTINVSTTGTGATIRLGSTYDNTSLGNAKLDLGTGIALTRNAGTSGTITTNIGTLSGAAGSFLGGSNAGSGTFIFSIGARNEDATFAGSIVDGSTKTALTKTGSAMQTLSGANTYTGATNVNAGTLLVSGSVANTSQVNVNSGGTLLLGGAGNRINDSANVVLAAGATPGAGGIFQSGGLSEGPANGAAGAAAAMGVLTLSANSTLDFTTGNTGTGSNLLFAGLNYTSGDAVRILNWTGIAGADNGSAANDRLLFGSSISLTDSQLAGIQFYDDSNHLLGSAKQISFNGYSELVANTSIPEPSTWFAALGLLGLVGVREGRRLRERVRARRA